MAGTIEVSKGVLWSAATWVFVWVLGEIAEDPDDPDLAAELAEIVDMNLGWASVCDLASDQRADFLRTIRTGIVERADNKFPPSISRESGAFKALEELPELVSEQWPVHGCGPTEA